MAKPKKKNVSTGHVDWPRREGAGVPHDVNLMDILTIQCRVVMVTNNKGQDEAAIVAFKRRAADLLAIMRMLGDRRCSMKVEWRKGIDAWSDVELSTADIEDLEEGETNAHPG